MSFLHRRIAHLAAVAGRFMGNTRGTTAIVTAVGGTAFVGFAALAVDVGVVEFQRQNVQRAVDSALLTAIATQRYNPKDLSPMKTAIQSHLTKTLPADLAESVTITLAPKAVGEETALEVTASMPWSWSSSGLLGGGGGGNFTVTSLAFEQSKPIELALVLDTTASMTASKMAALKTAANELVDMLMLEGGETKVGVVPFGDHVNIGKGFRGASWLYIPQEHTVTAESCWDVRDLISQTNCRFEVRTKTTCSDGVCTTTTANERVCDEVYSPWYKKCEMRTHVREWSGCVGSRPYPLNVRDVQTFGNSVTNQYPGLFTGVTCPSTPITPLTGNKQAVRNAINALNPAGNTQTYIPAGLLWGFNMLSSHEPLSEAVPYTETDVPKVMVLMTDGVNSVSTSPSWYLPTGLTIHRGINPAEADVYTSQLCENIKAEGIELYTVAFEVPNSSMVARLRNCATSPEHAFTAQNANQLTSVFEEIGLSLRKLSLGH